MVMVDLGWFERVLWSIGWIKVEGKGKGKGKGKEKEEKYLGPWVL